MRGWRGGWDGREGAGKQWGSIEIYIETYISILYIYSLVHPQQEVVQTRHCPREVFPQLADCLVDVDTAHSLPSSSAAGHPTAQASEHVKVVIIIGRHCSGGVDVLVVIVCVCVEVVEVSVGLFIVGRIT